MSELKNFLPMLRIRWKGFMDFLPILFAQIPLHWLIIEKWKPPLLGDGYLLAVIFLVFATTFLFWRGIAKKENIRRWFLYAGLALSIYMFLYQNTVHKCPGHDPVQVSFCLARSEMTPLAREVFKRDYFDLNENYTASNLLTSFGDQPSSVNQIWMPWAINSAGLALILSYFFLVSATSFSWGLIYVWLTKRASRKRSSSNRPNS